MTIRVVQIPCLADNYAVLLHDDITQRTVLMDAPDEGAILSALNAQDWSLSDVLVTHRHFDHIQAIPALRSVFPHLRVIAPAKEGVAIADVHVQEGNVLELGTLQARVIETPGHTLGHVAYVFDAQDIVFVGDTLFSLGCGRLFEGTAADMFHSFRKLAALPGQTHVYCGHEYTQANAHFALTIEPESPALIRRVEEVTALRAKGAPTLPTTIAQELATNPFFRTHVPAVQQSVGSVEEGEVAIFAALRRKKDIFQ